MNDRNPTNAISVVLTVDVEPDNAWENHLNPSVANVRELLGLQKLLDKYGAKATCLVTYRVVQDPQAREVLEELVNRGAEIGAHFHPWENPPFMESGIDTKYPIFPHELPLAVFEEKFARLTEAISKRFDPPTSYRGGRWSIVPEHLPVLERLGFQVDTSVTPLIDWRDKLGLPASHNGCGGIDWRFAPQDPYYPDDCDFNRKGNSSILEIPISVAFTRRALPIIHRNYGALPTILKRILRKSECLRPVWATPAEESEKHLLQMTRAVLDNAAPVINITLHSSEIAVGGSPATQTRADVEEVFRKIELMLDLLAAHERSVFTTLTKVPRMLAEVGLPERETNSDS